MERSLELFNGLSMKSDAAIDDLLEQRRTTLQEKKFSSPRLILEGIDLSKTILTKIKREIVGVLKVDFGGEKPFTNTLYEIPDLTINLNREPETEVQSPRTIMPFILSSGGETVRVDVLFDETYGHYDKTAVEALVRQDLLEALQKQEWQCDWTGAWFVVK